MERVHLVIGDALLERGLRYDGVRPGRNEAEPDRDAVDVGVDRKVRTVQREQEHACRGLRPHAWKGHERVPEIRIGHGRERPLIQRHATLADPPQHRANAYRLRGAETTAADRTGERRQRRIGDLVPRIEPSTEVGVRPIAVCIARVLRQDGKDKLLERRQVSRWWRCAVGTSETTRDGAETPPVHSSERIGNGRDADNVGIK